MSGPNMQILPNTNRVNISTANSNLNGTGTITTLITAGEDGAIINSIVIKSQVTNASGMIRLFLINNSDTKFLIREVPVPATTPSGVVQSFSAIINTPIVLQTGFALGVSTQNAEQFSVIADGINFRNCNCS